MSSQHLVYPGGPDCQPNCPGEWSAYHDGYADGYERGERTPAAFSPNPDGTMEDALARCSDGLGEALRKVQSLRDLTALQAKRIHELEDEAGDDSYLDDEPEVPSGGPD